ncbi:MAPEG family protein [Elioraea rosea]|uniref:MAPEG family protein n=1 Tax=Elioraea rosea TaxID=2492390 RepID=UPI001184415C|nr:MAPEG family protein [Elioraea rosea]
MRLVSASLALIGLAASALLWWLLGGVIVEPRGASSMAVRLGFGLAALLPAVLLLAAMLLAQMLLRFASGTFDPLAGRESRFLLVNQRVITNTIEQLAVFAPSLLAWAAGAEARAMPWIIALGIVFGAARLAFWIGYLIDPVARALGMAPTAVASLLALGAAIHAWLT